MSISPTTEPPSKSSIDDVAMPDELAERGRGLALAKSALGLLSHHRDKSGNHWRLISQGIRHPWRPNHRVVASPKPGYRIHGRAIRDFDIRTVSRSSAGPGSSRRPKLPLALWPEHRCGYVVQRPRSGDPRQAGAACPGSPSLTIARRRRWWFEYPVAVEQHLTTGGSGTVAVAKDVSSNVPAGHDWLDSSLTCAPENSSAGGWPGVGVAQCGAGALVDP